MKNKARAPIFQRPTASPERQVYYDRLDKENATALWDVIGDVLIPEPQPSCMPAMWSYELLRPLLMEAADLISAQEAERRVLLLENPGLRGGSRISQTLFVGLQLVMPNEIAGSHRHIASAFRLVLEGSGGYTAVDGEKTTMHPGDFILTPSWTFHDHGNPGNEPVVWMDGLDVPMVHFFDSMFAERIPGPPPSPTRNEGDAAARYGTNLLPLDYKPDRLTGPMFNYPYSRSREALEELYRNGPVHRCHGVKMQYANPATGGYPIPTLGAFLQLLPVGFSGGLYRSTDETVYCVTDGRGRSRVGDKTFDWKKNDIFVVPSWCPVAHESEGEAVLFSFSNRAAQKALGFWREEYLE
jgi:gentisate 1,2-dioxygenase